MYYIGCDPDTHNTALAVIDADGMPVAVYVIKTAPARNEDAAVGMVRAVAAMFFDKVSVGNLLPEANAGIAAVAVEGQEIYHGVAGRTKNTKSILSLGPVSGAVLACSSLRWPEAHLYFPQPKAWKGQVPKGPHQARTFGKMGMTFKQVKSSDGGYCYPLPGQADHVLGGGALTQGQWKHAADAFGLALYAREITMLTKKRTDFAIREVAGANVYKADVAVGAAAPAKARKRGRA